MLYPPSLFKVIEKMSAHPQFHGPHGCGLSEVLDAYLAELYLNLWLRVTYFKNYHNVPPARPKCQVFLMKL